MRKLTSLSIQTIAALSVCVVLWAGTIAFIGVRHNNTLEVAKEGEVWLGKDLLAPYDFNVLRDTAEISQEIKNIYKQTPNVIPLSFDDTSKVIAQQHMEFVNAFDTLFAKKKREYLGKLMLPVDSADTSREADSIRKRNQRVLEENDEFQTSDHSRMVTIGKYYIKSFYENHMVLNESAILDGDFSFMYDSKVYSRQQLLNTALLEDISDLYSVEILHGVPDWKSLSASAPWAVDLFQKALPQHPLSTLDISALSDEIDRVKMNVYKEIQKIDTIKTAYKKGDLVVAQGKKVGPEQILAINSLRVKTKDTLLSAEESRRINLANFLLIALVLLGGSAMTSYAATGKTLALRHSLVTISLIGLFGVTVAFAELYIPEYVTIVPLAIAPILMLAFFNRETALLVLLTTAGISSLIVSDGWSFLFRHLLVGVGVVYCMKSIRYWSDFLRLSVLVLALNVCFDVILFLMRLADVGVHALWLLPSVGIQAFLSFLALPFILLFERLYGTLSELRLVELSDINKPLLKNLSINTPGTFQHSLQVANLAEHAAEKIGADSLLVKTGALYHDIGKMQEPEFFIENQAAGKNPHDKLAPVVSAKKIIDHVSHGTSLAKEYRLPQALQRFILTHHGDSRVEYFYQLSLRDDEITRESDFLYPGPPPKSKEEAILMMADAAEASSKSLKAPNEASISDMVDKVINKQIQEGQFRQANISLHEIHQCKSAFKERLNNIHHIRISYPPEAKKSLKDN